MAIRLGVIVPSGNTLIEPEFGRLSLENVTFHFTRIVNYLDTEEELAAMIEQAPAAAELLSQAQVHAVVFGCTGGSFLKGEDYDQTVIQKMQERVSMPCTTTSTAAVAGLKELGVKKLTLLTPYEQWLTDRGVAYFQAHGFEVAGERHLGITDALKMAQTSPEEILEWAKTGVYKDSDGVFISCTCFPAMAVAEELEQVLGIPVVTSNQASAWQLLKLAGHSTPVSGYGKLLQSLQVKPLPEIDA
jgi:maleate isomerase